MVKYIIVRRILACAIITFLSISQLGAWRIKGPAGEEKKLVDEIVAAYYSLDQWKFADFIRKHRNKFKDEFLVKVARWGWQMQADWIFMAEAAAKAKESYNALAYILIFDGELHMFTKQNEARAVLDEAIKLFKQYNDNRGLGSALRKKAVILSANEGIAASINMLNEAISFSTKAGDYSSLGFEYLQIAMLSIDLGKYDDALENLQSSLFYFQKCQSTRGIAHYNLEMARIFAGTYQYKKAETHYLAAYEGFKNVLELNGIGDALKGLGEVYYALGKFQKANEYYDIAIEGYWEWNSWSWASNVFIKKGEQSVLSGNYIDAIRCYNLALPFFWERHEALGQGDIYKALGDIHFMRNDYGTAEEYYSFALQYYEQTDAIGQMGDISERSGTIYLVHRQFDLAEEMFHKAYSFYQMKGDYIGLGNVMKGLADVRLAQNDVDVSLEYYNQALYFLEKGRGIIGQGVVYSKIGDLEIRFNHLKKALASYDLAIDFHQRSGDIEAESYSRHERAAILERNGKVTEAKKEFQKALEILEGLRMGTVFNSLKKSYMKKIWNLYQETVMFMLRHGFKKEAFRFADSMKARLFLDQLAEGLEPIQKGLSHESKVRESKLVAELTTLYRQIQQADQSNELLLNRLQRRVKEVRRELDELLIKIRVENPAFGSVQYPQSISFDSMTSQTLRTNETLLQYFITPEKIFCFVISKSGFEIVPLELTEKTLDTHVEQLKETLSDSKSNWLTRNRIAYALYCDIFKPIKKYLSEDNDLIIVPDGRLALIPFESLIMERFKKGKRPKYLIEKYKINYIQSASVLKIVREHYRRQSKTNRFIGFGDPVYDYESFSKNKPEKNSISRGSNDSIQQLLRGQYLRENGTFDRLEGTGQEVKAIGAFFQDLENSESVLYLRQNALEEKAKSEAMKHFDYIHFSCHGLLSDDFQSLVLSQNIPTQTEDGYFTLNEIMNCEFNAKLVVLSACQSGAGKLEKGEGVTGLTRAVMYAGTPAVIASLWKVDDEATKELMVKFYENLLKHNMTKSEALRKAKLSLMDIEKFSSPRLWSAFVLYGE